MDGRKAAAMLRVARLVGEEIESQENIYTGVMEPSPADGQYRCTCGYVVVYPTPAIHAILEP